MRPRLFPLSAWCWCLVVGLAMPTAGQQIASVFEGEVVVTATGTEEAADELPLPVTVIDREEIDDRQSESVAEVLRRTPGMTVVQAGGDGSAVAVFTFSATTR